MKKIKVYSKYRKQKIEVPKEIMVPLGNIDPINGELILFSPRALAEGKIVPMEKMVKGEDIIDRCPLTGGIWLDKEEVSRVGKKSFLKYLINYWR